MNSRKTVLFLIDLFFLISSYVATFAITLLSNEITVSNSIEKLSINALVFAVCIFTVRIALKVYFNVWRFANVSAYTKIIICDLIGWFFGMLITRFVLFDLAYISVWMTLIIVVFFTLQTLVSRFAYQIYMNWKGDNIAKNKTYVAIVGAGKTGSLLVEELLHNSNSKYKPVCFVDVDKYKVGNYISNIKILKESERIFKDFKLLQVKEIFIALPKLTSSEIKKMYDFYSRSGCKIKLYDFAINEQGISQGDKRLLREIRVEDLLFRDSLNVNNENTFDYYKDKVVLITGGGGSIGSELCRQVAKASPKKLIIFDIYENNAYDIQQELQQHYGDKLDLAVEIGSVRDTARLDILFATYKPEIVFHAAAHKHVPLMENSSCEAIKNNVLGTYKTANAAEKHGVKKFILISTDKAVNPTNVMGASKRLCEMVVQSRYDSSSTVFAAVRFGNVLGSNGSVIPLFKRQIEAGGPVTITDKRIIRYFMTIPEASQLVMQAGAMATRGEIFVLDMGSPVKIIDLATNMIKLAGYTPYVDIDIVETGLRPGEKLYEELLIKTETCNKTENDLIFIEKDTPLSRQEIDEKIEVLKASLQLENDEIRKVLKQLVPTYHSAKHVNKNAEESDEMKMVMS